MVFAEIKKLKIMSPREAIEKVCIISGSGRPIKDTRSSDEWEDRVKRMKCVAYFGLACCNL